MIPSLIGLALGAVAAVIGLRYDRRTPEQKLAADRRKLGYAVGVPTLFNKRD